MGKARPELGHHGGGQTATQGPDHGEVILDPASLTGKKEPEPEEGEAASGGRERNDSSWELPELVTDTGAKWSELDTRGKLKQLSAGVLKMSVLALLLYMFFCSLDLLSTAFSLIGGKTAGEVFQNSELLQNPVVGVMLGVLVTVVVQSSSTSTSIVVTMVAGNLMTVKTGIPIVMGANIGTSVTSTIVAMTQAGDRRQFKRAFAASGVLSVFNWLTMIVLLPVEVSTGYLLHLTTEIVDHFSWATEKGANVDLLRAITHPFVDLLIQLDRQVQQGWSVNDPRYDNSSLLKKWCDHITVVKVINVTEAVTLGDGSPFQNVTEVKVTMHEGTEKCVFLFNVDLADVYIGLIILFLALLMLCGGLVLIVKVLHSVMKGSMAKVIKKTINASFPYVPWMTGYLAILMGGVLTFLLQSSSVFTSALVPLVGIGVLSLDRVYPLMLGSNIGTTTTSILAALTATGGRLKPAIQMSLCHLFFNLSGILLFYPVPCLRIPVPIAKKLGKTTARYRWFALLFLLVSFLVLPVFLVIISLAGKVAMYAVVVPMLTVIICTVVINAMQDRCPGYLPPVFRSWDWLPEWMHSLEPWDRQIAKLRCSHKLRTGGSLSVPAASVEHSEKGIDNPSFG